MAYTATTPNPRILDRIAVPFRAIGSLLMMLVEARSRIRALEALHATSDAELAARGTTRENELRRIVGIGSAL